MADNYLEKHYEEYLKRKAEWEKKKKNSPHPSHKESELKKNES